MNRDDVISYLGSKRIFRKDKEAQSRPGTSNVIKNMLYAYALEQAIDYVRELPDDAPALAKLEDVFLDVFNDHSEIHTDTIHCSLGKPSNCEKWFNDWVNYVVSVLSCEEEKEQSAEC